MTEYRPPLTILYLTFARFPSSAAHSVNILKMGEAIKRLGYELILVADLRKEPEDIFSDYRIKHPFSTQSIKMSRMRFLGRVLFLIKAWFVIRKRNPNVLFTRDVFNAYFVSKFKKPFLYEIHEYPQSHFRKYLTRKILKSSHLKKAVFISEKLKNLFLNEFPQLLSKKTCTVAHDGVDPENFRIETSVTDSRSLLHLPEKAWIAGYTGSLFEGRGGDILLRLAQKLPDVYFLVVGGEGKHLELFMENVRSLKLSNIRVTGHVSHSQIPLYLHCCDALLMPYQTQVLHRQKKHDTASYMSPLKMFEYMASGKPIVASRLPVVEEVLQDGQNALLVEASDPEEWVQAIKKLKEHKSLSQNLGKKARETVQSFTWEKRAEEIFSQMDFQILE